MCLFQNKKNTHEITFTLAILLPLQQTTLIYATGVDLFGLPNVLFMKESTL